VTEAQHLRVLLVDPSLFTAPYDAALTRGLVAARVDPLWAVRPLRAGDREEIGAAYVDAFFYRRVDQLKLPKQLRALAKGVAHAFGLAGVLFRVLKNKPDVVHFQWLVVPPLDSAAIALIRLFAPVVLTVHDTVPFNGEHISFLQNLAFDLPIKLSDAVVVHTRAGRDALARRGVAPGKLNVIPHGPLPLNAQPSPASSQRRDARITFVVFGEIKTYKGIDVLVEALALLPAELREQARVVIAGRPRMDMGPLLARISELGLEGAIEIRAQRLDEQEMADLFEVTDCFLFPYRQIDASGVYFLVKSLGKWLIASRVGIFAEDMREGEQGALIPPADPRALADAMASAIRERPAPAPVQTSSAWAAIGETTRELYRSVLAKRSAPSPSPAQVEGVTVVPSVRTEKAAP
jgi:glycosyltransferase involved in cell wall biosynthesis